MLDPCTQFKVDTGMKILDVAKTSGITAPTVRKLILGKLKNNRSFNWYIETITSKTNIPEDLLRSYAMGTVVIRDEIKHLSSLREKAPTYKTAIQRLVELEAKLAQVIGE